MTYWWKTIVAVVLLAAVAGGRIAAAACGDINGNGSVDIGDALSLSTLVAGGSVANVCGTGHPLDCADLFKDGKIDNADLSVLVDHIAGLKTLFDICTGPSDATTLKCSGNDPDTGRPVANLSAQTITKSQIWPANCTVVLKGIIFVQSPVTGPTTVITMQPGVIVKGLGNGTANPAVLIFLPGSKINAQGTPSAPIIMTSGQPVGQRGIGDWGGLLLNGKSTVNRPNCVNNAEGIPAVYGGCDATDSSGIMTYTRVEFSGIEFTPNNELNVITLNGVGNGTVINHIQANAGGDDCIEWFGGTVNVKYMVSSGCADDGFDYQLGTTGTRQYGLQVQYGPFLQTGNQSRGIEADNSEFGFDDLPRSNPKFCNLTMIGARDNDINLGSQGGLFFRRGTAGTVANSIVANYRGSCINLNDAGTAKFACDSASTLKTSDPFLTVENTLCFDNGGTGARGTGTKQIDGVSSGANCTATQFYGMITASNNVTPASGVGTDPNIPTRWDDVLATGPYPAKVPNVIPTSTTGFPPAIDCHTVDDSLDTTNYIGAFDPAGGPGANWLDTPGGDRFHRWISFDVN